MMNDTASKTILIVDDEPDIRTLIGCILEDEGYEVLTAANSQQAMEALQNNLPDLVILDIWLEGSELDGIGILEAIKQARPILPVIMISGHGTIDTAVSSLKKGAYDFLEKPFKTDRLLVIVKRALETLALRRENEKLKASQAPAKLHLIGQAPVLKGFENALKRVAKMNSRVILEGEAGTGKTAAARFIHEQSDRGDKPFIVLNCATLSPERFEVEIFGAEKGQASSPYQIDGLLHAANGGSLLLDEVADMPLTTQAKIIRVLQNNSFHRIGGKADIQTDIRFIATTHKDLQDEIAQGRFREDLYYRLNVVPIKVPSLREYREDLVLLIEFFTNQIAQRSDLKPMSFSPDAIAILAKYDWPGNVRQLRNIIERCLILTADKPEITPDDLPQDITGLYDVHAHKASTGETNADHAYDHLLSLPLKEARTVFEREYLSKQVKRFGGNISKTSEFVGMQRSALHRKIKQLQLSAIEDNSSVKSEHQ